MGWLVDRVAELFLTKKLKLIVFEICIVKTWKDVWNTKTLWDALRRFKLLLVERDIVVFSNILKWCEQIILHVLLSLFLLDDNCSFDVQIVLFFQDVVKRRICSTINSDLLELVPEMILDRLFLEVVPFQDYVVLPFKDEAIDNEVLLFQEIGLLKELYNFFWVYIVITLFNIHRDKIELRFIYFLPLLHKFFILFHDIVIIEDSKAKLVFEHLWL